MAIMRIPMNRYSYATDADIQAARRVVSLNEDEKLVVYLVRKETINKKAQDTIVAKSVLTYPETDYNDLKSAEIVFKGVLEYEEEKLKPIKDRLVKENPFCHTRGIRFNTIQYLCRSPGIDPVEMAVSFRKDGYTILFDDRSISERENKAHEAAVEKAFQRVQQEAAQGKWPDAVIKQTGELEECEELEP